MAITVITQPEQAVLSKDTLEYILETNNYYTNTGAYEVRELWVVGIPAVDAVIFAAGFNFVFKTAPDNSGNQLKTYTSSPPALATYVAELVEGIRKNYYVESHFRVTYEGVNGTPAHVIRFTARKKEANRLGGFYALLEPAFHSSPAITAGAAQTVQPNFRFFFDLFYEETYGAGDFVPLFRSDGAPDLNNRFRVDISQQIDGKIKPVIPAFNAAKIFPLEILRRYYAAYTEYYGDPGVPHNYEKLAITFALPGGRQYLNRGAAFYAPYFTASSGRKFLTTMPASGTYVTKNQHQYLSAYMDHSSGGLLSISIGVKLYYDDGTNSGPFTARNATSDLFQNKIVCARVGYNELEIDTWKAAGKEVVAYEVVFSKPGGTIYTQTFKFIVDSNYYHSEHNFLFINSYGVPEVIGFYGDKESSVAYENNVIELSKPITNTSGGVYEGNQAEINRELIYNYKLSTGYRNKSFLNYFMDFLISPSRLEQLSNKYAKIVVPKQKVQLDNDKDTAFAITMQYQNAWVERSNA